MVASNTKDCFREFVGKTVRGVLFDALPVGKGEGNKSLVFDNGRALTIASNGSFWVDENVEVQRAINFRLSALRDVKWEIEETLTLAGVSIPPQNTR